MFKDLKKELYEAHLTLEKYGLVAYTSGNVSVRADDYVIIKPSGIPYNILTPEDFVVIDLGGNIIEGDKKPSIDTQTHLYIYKNSPSTNSIIHTHSPYATVWAIWGKTIPVLCTAHADVFGEEIPVTEYAPVGSEAIGKAVLNSVGKSGTVLLRKHGVMVLGNSVNNALKKAIFLEEIAKTSFLVLINENIEPLPKNEVDHLYLQHHTKYGQK